MCVLAWRVYSFTTGAEICMVGLPGILFLATHVDISCVPALFLQLQSQIMPKVMLLSGQLFDPKLSETEIHMQVWDPLRKINRKIQ